MKSHQIVVGVGPLEEIMNVRFGSFAAVQVNISLMSGFGSKADVRFEQRPIFDSPLTANSGLSSSKGQNYCILDQIPNS